MEVWCAHALGSGHRTNIGAAVLLVGDPVQDDFDVDMYSRHDEQYKSTLISKFSKIISIQSLVGPAKCVRILTTEDGRSPVAYLRQFLGIS